MDFQFDEKRSLEILIDVLKQSGLQFRMKEPNEEGGFSTSKRVKEKSLQIISL